MSTWSNVIVGREGSLSGLVVSGDSDVAQESRRCPFFQNKYTQPVYEFSSGLVLPEEIRGFFDRDGNHSAGVPSLMVYLSPWIDFHDGGIVGTYCYFEGIRGALAPLGIFYGNVLFTDVSSGRIDAVSELDIVRERMSYSLL